MFNKHDERNYTTEKEMLAIVYAVVKLRTYLLGQHFHIITDHKALIFFTSSSYYNSRLMRWSLLLQQYSFSIQYCKGKENLVADFFSRNILNIQPALSNDECRILNLQREIIKSYKNIHHPTIYNLISMFPEVGLKKEIKNIKNLQQQDEKIKTLINNIKMNNEVVGYCIKEDVLFQRSRLTKIWRLVIPDDFTKALIDEVHMNLGHVGMYKIIKYLDKLYFWKGMHKQIKKIIKHCDLCQKTKPNNVAMTGKYCAIIPSSPHQLVTIDLYGPLPKIKGGAISIRDNGCVFEVRYIVSDKKSKC